MSSYLSTHSQAPLTIACLQWSKLKITPRSRPALAALYLEWHSPLMSKRRPDCPRESQPNDGSNYSFRSCTTTSIPPMDHPGPRRCLESIPLGNPDLSYGAQDNMWISWNVNLVRWPSSRSRYMSPPSGWSIKRLKIPPLKVDSPHEDVPSFFLFLRPYLDFQPKTPTAPRGSRSMVSLTLQTDVMCSMLTQFFTV